MEQGETKGARSPFLVRERALVYDGAGLSYFTCELHTSWSVEALQTRDRGGGDTGYQEERGDIRSRPRRRRHPNWLLSEAFKHILARYRRWTHRLSVADRGQHS